jgi:hypothetical protein
VQPVSVAEVADELYALAPAEFTAARDDRARQMRAAGQPDDAAAIKKLARPTASAWLVNQLARTESATMARLFGLGEELQEAQRTLAGDRLRELSVQRRRIIGDLMPAASGLADRAGQSASSAVLGEVRATLEAALADAGARDAVRSGRLTKALAYAGLGDVDLTGALGVPTRSPEADAGAGAQPAAEAGARRAADASTRRAADAGARATAALRAARDAAADATAALEDAQRAVESIDEQRQFLHRRIDHLEQEIAEARAAHAQLAREASQAERRQAIAARRVDSARRDVDRARRALGEIE